MRSSTRRAVEMSKNGPRHNTILPFTRNVVGPMDYTPVTFSDSKFPHTTTDAHELALSVIFESGVQHFADSVESYRSLPDAPETIPQRRAGGVGRNTSDIRRTRSRGASSPDEPALLVRWRESAGGMPLTDEGAACAFSAPGPGSVTLIRDGCGRSNVRRLDAAGDGPRHDRACTSARTAASSAVVRAPPSDVRRIRDDPDFSATAAQRHRST